MSEVTLLLGDCREVLRGLGDNSVDAVVCDPPYELGFMGRHWDSQGVAYDPAVWGECYRVLKPGGYLLAFGGSRTYHRLACAIEDAGFGLHPLIGWVYGCLSDDTEILTEDGWQSYTQLLTGSMVMCYNVTTGAFQFMPVEQVYVYPYADTAFSIRSDCTDQIVSRNHRCLVERGGTFIFQRAETLYRQENVPILETMPSLPETFCGGELARVPKEEPLFAGMYSQDTEHEDEGATTNRETQRANNQVPCLWERDLQTLGVAQEDQNPDLFKTLQWNLARGRMGKAGIQRKSGLDGREPSFLQSQDERGEQPGVERGSDLLSQAWQLSADQICPLPNGISSDGAQRWLCHGASAFCGAAPRPLSQSRRGGSPYRSQPAEQRLVQSTTLCQQYSPQEIRGYWQPSTTLADVTPIYYNGIVWCVSVPTGAFVARRNGHIFITGNSGFPKATNLSKMLDKEAGAEREVVGENPNWRASKSAIACPQTDMLATFTLPATALAARWNGWFYGRQSLKPAIEPICMAQKPSEGRMVDNVVKWGTGAVNVEACRVGSIGGETHTGGFQDIMVGGKVARGGVKTDLTPLGRFPANLIHDGSPEVLACFPETGGNGHGATPSDRAPGAHTDFIKYSWKSGAHHADGGGSSARFFTCCPADDGDYPPIKYCPKASRAEREAGLDDFPVGQGFDKNTSQTIQRRDPDTGEVTYSEYHPSQRRNGHCCVKPLSLMRWLCRLVTPPGGTVLDPFMGSGSTGIAAVIEGFEFVGIEKELEYFQIAQARIAHAPGLALPLFAEEAADVLET